MNLETRARGLSKDGLIMKLIEQSKVHQPPHTRLPPESVTDLSKFEVVMRVNKIKFLVRVWMFTLKHFQTRQVNLFGLYSYRFKSPRSLLNRILLLCSWITQINSHERSDNPEQNSHRAWWMLRSFVSHFLPPDSSVESFTSPLRSIYFF